jgi:CBS domain-containing protein
VIVREALVPDPRVVAADAGLREAAELLTRPNVRSVLVVEGERLVGIATAETLVAAIARRDDIQTMTAADVCDTSVATIGPDGLIDDALRLMAEGDLERLPVVEDGRLLGILPREPLVRRLAEDESPGEPWDS